MADFKELNLDTLHQSILDSITAAFPAVQTVEDYPETRKRIQVPAILVELSELDEAIEDDAGTEQLPLRARFEARIIIGFRTPNAKREIRKLATSLALHVKNQRWSLGAFGVGPAEVLGVYPDEFEPELDQYEVWRVEWQQLIHIGVNVWAPDPDAVVPTTVMLGYDPEIGPPNEEDYIQVVPNE